MTEPTYAAPRVDPSASLSGGGNTSAIEVKLRVYEIECEGDGTLAILNS